MAYAIYIAAAAVIGLLIGFVALSVLWLKSTVMKNIRSRTLGLISVYDELLEEKSRELTELAEHDAWQSGKAEETEAAAVGRGNISPRTGEGAEALSAAQMLQMTERSGGAVYRERTLGSVYRKIRESFAFDPNEILAELEEEKAQTAQKAEKAQKAGKAQKVQNAQKAQKSQKAQKNQKTQNEHNEQNERETQKTQKAQKTGSPAGRLLRELSPDTIYRLSSMPRETQEAILREALDDEGAALLKEYMQTHRTFSALGFYDHLRLRAACEPDKAYLHIPRGMWAGCTKYGGAEIVPDDEICEGFCLEESNILYDYSIRMRELS